MDVLQALRLHGGVAHRADLERLGVRGNELAAALQAGMIVKPCRGVFAFRGVPQDHVLATYFRAQVSCVSAVRAHGIAVLDSDERTHLEVETGRGSHYRPSKAFASSVIHRSHSQRGSDRVVSPIRAIDMASRCVSPRAQLVMLDSALNRQIIARGALDEMSLTPAPVSAWLRARCDGGAESVPETCARIALAVAGLSVRTQVAFAGVGRVDLLVEGAVVVEIDGRDYHSDPQAFSRDRLRDRRLLARGLSVLRFTYADAVHRPESLVADVLAVLYSRAQRLF